MGTTHWLDQSHTNDTKISRLSDLFLISISCFMVKRYKLWCLAHFTVWIRFFPIRLHCFRTNFHFDHILDCTIEEEYFQIDANLTSTRYMHMHAVCRSSWVPSDAYSIPSNLVQFIWNQASEPIIILWKVGPPMFFLSWWSCNTNYYLFLISEKPWHSKGVFLYLPLCAIFTANVVFFILTIRKTYEIEKGRGPLNRKFLNIKNK